MKVNFICREHARVYAWKNERTFFIYVQELKMFCRKCGKEEKEIDNFCGKCGEKQQQKTVTEKREVKTLPLNFYKQFKREKWAGHFKPSKSSTSTSNITRKSERLMHSVTINIGIMKNVNLYLKPVGEKKLPSKVKTTINYDDSKKEHRKAFTSRPIFFWLRREHRKAFTSRPVFFWLRRICYSIQMEKKHFFCLESPALDFNLTPRRKSWRSRILGKAVFQDSSLFLQYQRIWWCQLWHYWICGPKVVSVRNCYQSFW